MFFYILSFCFFLSEIQNSFTIEIPIHGYTGQDIIISCYHMYAHNNRKYFCRDPCKDKDVLVSSDHSTYGRFTLKDFSNGLTVTITEVQESDSGIYWCGVDRVTLDTYHKVILRVSKDKTDTHTNSSPVTEIQLTTQTDPVFTSSASENIASLSTGLVKISSAPEELNDKGTIAVPVYSLLSVVMGLVVLVTVLTVGLFYVCWYKKRPQTPTRCVSRTSTHTHNEYFSEESNTFYENDSDGTPNPASHSPKHTENLRSTEDPIYQNIWSL